MATLKSAIKGNIVAGNNKYYFEQEKVGTIIETNEGDNYCTISLINRDGIQNVFYRVPVLYDKSDEGTVSWFPEKGEQVRVIEKNKHYTIVGPLRTASNKMLTYDIYSYGSNDMGGFIQ